jgi:hypothetical protein
VSSHTHNDLPVTTRREAERLYAALFGEPVPGVIAERFGLASAQLEANTAAEELRVYRRALARVADLEALELACRLTGRLGILSRKFHLMVCLAETLPQNRAHFIKDRDARLAAGAALLAGALRTATKLVKGILLRRRLDRA